MGIDYFYNNSDLHFSMSQKKNFDEDNDYSKKEIGDRVELLDFSSMTFLDDPLDYDDYDDIENVEYFIVIANQEKNEYQSHYTKYIQELIIVNPQTNKQYRIVSRHTKPYKP